VSLAWILAHLYSQPELLRRARAELAACSGEPSYAELSGLPFLNACIDESVRLHTMLPGNTVLRKAARDVRFGEVTIPRGSVLWLYPNAVHQDGAYFAEPASFCPMRFLRGDALRKQSEASRRPPPPSAALLCHLLRRSSVAGVRAGHLWPRREALHRREDGTSHDDILPRRGDAAEMQPRCSRDAAEIG